MELTAPNDSSATSRRGLFRIAAGVGIAAVAGPLIIAKASTAASATQRQWSKCSRCNGLWFMGNNTRGGCPAGDLFDGGHHHDGTGDYILKEDVNGGRGQSRWRWCKDCQGLFFEGNEGFFGICPSPSRGFRIHNMIGSGNYRLEDVGNRDGVGGQEKWRWCRKCSGLFYDAETPGGSGVCPADHKTHDSVGSGNYLLRAANSTRLPSPPY